MDIADPHKKNEIVFAYTIFDSGNKKGKNSLMISVVVFFGEYSKYGGLTEYSTRLLHYIITHGKVLYYLGFNFLYFWIIS